MALLSWMPRVRSLYSRYFSTMGASSLWALAVFWKRAESETISGEDRALLSSSYFNSVWSRRSNMGANTCRAYNGGKDYCTGTPLVLSKTGSLRAIECCISTVRFRYLSCHHERPLGREGSAVFPLAIVLSAKLHIPRFARNDNSQPNPRCQTTTVGHYLRRRSTTSTFQSHPTARLKSFPLEREREAKFVAAGAARRSPTRRRAVSPTPWPRSRRRWRSRPGHPRAAAW